jgi:hypothetical protein
LTCSATSKVCTSWVGKKPASACSSSVNNATARSPTRKDVGCSAANSREIHLGHWLASRGQAP